MRLIQHLAHRRAAAQLAGEFYAALQARLTAGQRLDALAIHPVAHERQLGIQSVAQGAGEGFHQIILRLVEQVERADADETQRPGAEGRRRSRLLHKGGGRGSRGRPGQEYIGRMKRGRAGRRRVATLEGVLSHIEAGRGLATFATCSAGEDAAKEPAERMSRGPGRERVPRIADHLDGIRNSPGLQRADGEAGHVAGHPRDVGRVRRHQ